MAATLKLTALEASAGSTITVDSATTLSLSADKLSVGGVLLSQGNTSVNVLTAASTDLADVAHTAMWTAKTKAIFSVDASGGAKTVQLPPANAAGRSTVSIVISVKTTSAVPATVSPNLVTVNNSSGTEVFTLYAKGDYVEFVSDGTNDIRTGDEHISAAGVIFLNTNESIAGGAAENMIKSGDFTLQRDWGALFDTSTDYRLDIPYACRVKLSAYTLTTVSSPEQPISPQIVRYYSGGSSSEYLYRPDNRPTNTYGLYYFSREWDLTVGDEIQFDGYNLHASAAQTMAGNVNPYTSCFGAWEIIRRY
jgi:hypothetical protein